MTPPFVSGSTWMTQNFHQIGSRPFWNLAVPGAHDAGTSVFTIPTFGSNACNTQTQSKDIFGQLQSGVRYFDFRPVTWPDLGDFYHGHFAAVEGFFLGAAGQSLSTTLEQLARFVQQPGCEKEVVILKLSHFLNLTKPLIEGLKFGFPDIVSGGGFGDSNFTDLTNAILNAMGPGLLYTSSADDISLNNATPAEIVSGSGRIIVVFDMAGEQAGGFPLSQVNLSNGIFSYNDAGNGPANLVVYDNYANMQAVSAMEADQKTKFQAFTPGPGQSFLLSWTLTETVAESIEAYINPANCISDLARSANLELEYAMQGWVNEGIISKSKIPAIVYTDFADDQGYALQTALYLNGIASGAAGAAA